MNTGLASRLTVGGLCGLAWSAGLRGAMAALSGPDSNVTWMGTFGWIIVPGTLTGVLLGWAEHLRRNGSGPRRRWLFLSPLLFTSVLLLNPAGLIQFLHDGLGGGALAIPLFGMLGGYAWSQRGPLWTRMIGRIILLAPIPAGLTIVVINAPVSPVSVWIGIYFYSFIIVLGIACAIPLAATPRPAGAAPPLEQPEGNQPTLS